MQNHMFIIKEMEELNRGESNQETKNLEFFDEVHERRKIYEYSR